MTFLHLGGCLQGSCLSLASDNKTQKCFNKFRYKTVTLHYHYASKTLGERKYVFFFFRLYNSITALNKQSKQELNYCPTQLRIWHVIFFNHPSIKTDIILTDKII